MPVSLRMISRSAPKAIIDLSFSSAKALDDTMRSGYPLTAQTKASDVPVEPPVYSTTVCPGDSSPRASAASIMARAIRSL